MNELRNFLSRSSGSEFGVGDIARHLRISHLQAYALCLQANREGWVVFHCSEQGILYIP